MRITVLKQGVDGVQKWVDITEFVESISVKFPDDVDTGVWSNQPEGVTKTKMIHAFGGEEYSTIEIVITIKE